MPDAEVPDADTSDAAPTDAAPTDAAAPPGSIDPTFGAGGRIDARGHSLAIDPLDRILVIAEGTLTRLTAEGAIDETFADHGVATLTATLADGTTIPIAARTAVALDSGRIVIGGHMNTSGYRRAIAIALTDAGAPDRTFGASGLVDPNLTPALFEASTLDADGTILFAGGIGSWTNYPLVVRIREDGTLVDGFGEHGVAQLVDHASSSLTAIDTAPSGRILVAGTRAATFGGESMYVTRGLTSAGVEDPGYAMSTHFPGTWPNVAVSVIALSDARTITAGTGAEEVTHPSFVELVGYDAAGQRDFDWGTWGLYRAPFGGRRSWAAGAIGTRDGHVVVLGSIQQYSATGSYPGDIALTRIDGEGRVDRAFGATGVVLLDLGTVSDVAFDLAEQSTGHIVVLASAGGPTTVLRLAP